MEIFPTQFQTMLCIVLNFSVIENLLAFQKKKIAEKAFEKPQFMSKPEPMANPA